MELHTSGGAGVAAMRGFACGARGLNPGWQALVWATRRKTTAKYRHSRGTQSRSVGRLKDHTKSLLTRLSRDSSVRIVSTP